MEEEPETSIDPTGFTSLGARMAVVAPEIERFNTSYESDPRVQRLRAKAKIALEQNSSPSAPSDSEWPNDGEDTFDGDYVDFMVRSLMNMTSVRWPSVWHLLIWENPHNSRKSDPRKCRAPLDSSSYPSQKMEKMYPSK